METAKVIRKSFKFRIYPTKSQVKTLEVQLSEARFLYNAALQERRDAWKLNKVSISYFDQSNQLKEIRNDGNLEFANFSASQDILRRVDKAFKAFFNRIKKNQKAGFPRFKGKNRFNSFTFPKYNNGCKIKENGKLYLQGIGDIKLKLHREVTGKIKTITVKKECEKWYVFFSVESVAEILPDNQFFVGIDVGLNAFATLSNGEQISNPRWFQTSQKKIRVANRSIARKQKGSSQRRKAVTRLKKIYAHIYNQRQDFQHKISRQIINNYGLIAVEDLNIKGLAKGMLGKQVLDASWGSFLSKLSYKAESAGRRFIKVNPNGTSQNCSVCGKNVQKPLKVRLHSCSNCGVVLDRDVNAAQNILTLGLSVLDVTYAVGQSVSNKSALF